MILPSAFLTLAESWVECSSEAEWRSAVSRAYYAAFHQARLVLEGFGFAVPHSDRGHAHVSQRLAYCGDVVARRIGMQLISLRRERNNSDYDLHRSLTQLIARNSVSTARSAIDELHEIEQSADHETIVDAIRRYEIDVLREPTWRR